MGQGTDSLQGQSDMAEGSDTIQDMEHYHAMKPEEDDFCNRDSWWHPKHGKPIKIRNMTSRHLRNTVAYLERVVSYEDDCTDEGCAFPPTYEVMKEELKRRRR